jgi:hypothetical protein
VTTTTESQPPEQIQVQGESQKPAKQPTAKTQPTTKVQPTTTTNQVQPVQQVAATQVTPKGTLPFTGYNAIPIFLVGLALLSIGFVMWRQTRRRPDES